MRFYLFAVVFFFMAVCCSLYRVEGCLPVCPPHMVLDEVTHRCVYVEDCKYCLVRESNTIRDNILTVVTRHLNILYL